MARFRYRRRRRGYPRRGTSFRRIMRRVSRNRYRRRIGYRR